MWFKKIKVPSPLDYEMTAVVLWEVRWESRHGRFCDNVQKEVEVFTTEEDARLFKASIERAHKLLRNTVDIHVTISKRS